MPFEDGQESQVEAPTADQSVESIQDNSTPAEQPQTNSNNPFWGELESKLLPQQWQLAQPLLAKADTEARQRIEKVNEQYAPWKAYADQGITPQAVQEAFEIVQALNDPNRQPEIYQNLHNFLKQEGRLPTIEELADEIQNQAAEDPEADPRDKQLQELQAKQQQFEQWVQSQYAQQAQAQAQQQADTWVQTEVARVKQAHPEFTPQDIDAILMRAAFEAQSGHDPENLDGATQAFLAERDRIRSAPRPGDSAPRIPGGTGGTPGSTLEPGSLGNKQTRLDAALARLTAGRG